MINFYIQGSKNLGLGHLSRIVLIYHELCKLDKKITVYLHGDELGKAYLKSNSINSINTSKIISISQIEKPDFWIIDSTTIWEDIFIDKIKESKKNVLLSPKFENNQIKIISHAFLRSDPFELKISNKIVGNENFVFNDGRFYRYTKGLNIGIALSGGETNTILSEIITSIINNKSCASKLNTLTIFMGSSCNISFERKTDYSHNVSIKFISTLESLWNYANEIDLMILGNGITVDECIIKQKDFLVYCHDINNMIPKSIYPQLVSSKLVFSIESLLDKLENTNNEYTENNFIVKNDITKLCKSIIEI